MIPDGLIITVAGMLVAFGFLGLMSFGTNLMSRAVERWFPEEPEDSEHRRPRALPDEAAVAVAIAAAHLHLNGTRHAQG